MRGERTVGGLSDRTRSGAGRSLRDRARDCAVALASAAVVAFLVAYALTSPSFRLEAAVAGIEGHAGRQAVVHGRVLEANGEAIADAEVRVHRPGAKDQIGRSGARGYFRLDLRGSCARYAIVLLVRAEKRLLQKALNRDVCPGQAVELQARVVADGQFVWMPTR